MRRQGTDVTGLDRSSIAIEVSRPFDLPALGTEWRALEAQAEGSFFQSWSWLGCLAAERFDRPILLRAQHQGRTIGLALFNQAGTRLALAESADPVRDAPFIEHNGPLLAADAPASLAEIMLQRARRIPGVRRLVLSGVSPALPPLARGTILRWQERTAPFVDLALVRKRGGDPLAILSGNTRTQIRRSLRLYAEDGVLVLARASAVAEALLWFEHLVTLHQESWRRRGRAGAFATPFMRRFHRTLITDLVGRGEIDMLRLAAADTVIGYLYNFRHRGRVHAYQSGFRHDPDEPRHKPGLCCHILAISRAVREGDQVYDFLAGADRYKQSLAGGSAAQMAWAEIVPAWSFPGILARTRDAVRRLRPGERHS